jgi:hypothetical protein
METLVQHSSPGSNPLVSWAAVIAGVVVFVWPHLLHRSCHELCSVCHCGSHVIPLVLAVQVYLLIRKIFFQSHWQVSPPGHERNLQALYTLVLGMQMPLVPAKFRVTLVFAKASSVKDCLTLKLFVLSSLFTVVFAASLWFFCHFWVYLFRLLSFMNGLLGFKGLWRTRLSNLRLPRQCSFLLWLLSIAFWPSWNMA